MIPCLRFILGLLMLLASLRADDAPRPNILLILTDDLGYGDLGCFGQRRYATPALDRLAAEGARLTHHYSAAPVCAPARASLLLGVHQGHANVRDNQFDKALEENHTLATVLRQAGYATAAVGKWGLHGQETRGNTGANPAAPAHPLRRGFERFFGVLRHIDGHEHYPKEAPYFVAKAKARGPVRVWDNRTEVTADLDRCYTTDLFTAWTKQYIVEHTAAAPQQPFFLYLAYDTPHAVLELPTQAYPAGGGRDGGVQWLGRPGHMINTASGKIDSWVHPACRADATAPADAPSWPEVYQRQATGVRRIDDATGDLLQLLADLHLAENTLVVFTSDNGPEMESMLAAAMTPEFFASFGPFDGIKRDLWEGGLRVPTLVRWPRCIPAGLVLDQPSAQWDWLPTFCEAAGVPAPARGDGLSLLPALAGRAGPWPERTLYFEYQVAGTTPDFPSFEPGRRGRRRNQMQAVRQGDYLGVRYDVQAASDDFEIYRIVTDPKETTNLARDPAYAPQQRAFQAAAMRARRPNASSPRPYDGALVPALAGQPAAAGVQWRAYAGPLAWVPNFAGLKPAAEGVGPRPDPAATGQKDAAGFCFTGYLIVPAEGEYTFTLTADTGAVFRLHEATLLDADYGYRGGTEKSATVRLQAGPHAFQLASIHARDRAAKLVLAWSGPDGRRQPIADAAFARALTPGPAVP